MPFFAASPLIGKILPEPTATAAVARLRGWHVHKASVAPLVNAAWAYLQNITAADSLCVVLAEQLAADFLTDDHNLLDGHTFPRNIRGASVFPLRP